MATTNIQAFLHEDSDSESVTSIGSIFSDDYEDHLPERIVAEFARPPSLTWYLVKWTDCPLLRSSWESIGRIQEYTAVSAQIFHDWDEEKKRQQEGKSKPLDLHAYVQAVAKLENAEAERRNLRHFKDKIHRVLSIVSS